jgi:hypothetical protein
MLWLIGFGAGRRTALLAEIFVEVSRRQYKQQAFAGWGCDSAARAIEQGGVERSELFGWLS